MTVKLDPFQTIVGVKWGPQGFLVVLELFRINADQAGEYAEAKLFIGSQMFDQDRFYYVTGEDEDPILRMSGPSSEEIGELGYEPGDVIPIKIDWMKQGEFIGFENSDPAFQPGVKCQIGDDLIIGGPLQFPNPITAQWDTETDEFSE